MGFDYERYRISSIQTTQEVKLYFNFVGHFVPPKFAEVELTPKELEEIRKRKERRDRFHQEQLKRKASGAQKRYYVAVCEDYPTGSFCTHIAECLHRLLECNEFQR